MVASHPVPEGCRQYRIDPAHRQWSFRHAARKSTPESSSGFSRAHAREYRQGKREIVRGSNRQKHIVSDLSHKRHLSCAVLCAYEQLRDSYALVVGTIFDRLLCNIGRKATLPWKRGEWRGSSPSNVRRLCAQTVGNGLSSEVFVREE